MALRATSLEEVEASRRFQYLDSRLRAAASNYAGVSARFGQPGVCTSQLQPMQIALAPLLFL